MPDKRYERYLLKYAKRARARSREGLPQEPSPMSESEWAARDRLRRGHRAETIGEWLAKQNDRTKALAGELLATAARRGARPAFDARTFVDEKGRTVYEVHAEIGRHQSLESHEHALSLFVDAHRTGAEDREENYVRVGKALARTEAGRAKISDKAAEVRRGRINAGREPHPEPQVLAAAERKAGIYAAADIARAIRAANPNATGEERDALFLQELAAFEVSEAQTEGRERAERERAAVEAAARAAERGGPP